MAVHADCVGNHGFGLLWRGSGYWQERVEWLTDGFDFRKANQNLCSLIQPVNASDRIGHKNRVAAAIECRPPRRVVSI